MQQSSSLSDKFHSLCLAWGVAVHGGRNKLANLKDCVCCVAFLCFTDLFVWEKKKCVARLLLPSRPFTQVLSGHITIKNK